MLGDRGAALDLLAPDVSPEGAGDTAQVDAGVLPIVAVLDGDGGAQKVFRNLVQRDPRAVATQGVNHFVEQCLAGAVIDLCGFKGLLGGLDLPRLGQVLGKVGIDPSSGTHSPDDGSRGHEQHHEQQDAGDAQILAQAAALFGAAALAALQGDVADNSDWCHNLTLPPRRCRYIVPESGQIASWGDL